MSTSLTSSPLEWSYFPWWRARAFWVPLLAVSMNVAFLIAWPFVERVAIGLVATPWIWRPNFDYWLQGWTMGYIALAAIWLSFGTDHPAIRFPAVLVAVGSGAFAVLSHFGGFWNLDFAREYYLPKWPSVCLVAIQWIAALHLVFFPLRRFLHWRVDFSPATIAPAAGRRFQFTLRDIFWLTLVSAIALAVIRAAQVWLSRSGRNDVLFMPTYLRLMSFGQILIPSLACAWCILGRKRQWIGGLVVVLALTCPAVLVYTGLYMRLSLGVRELWWAHWMNVGAASCVAINLIALRLCRLRGTVVWTANPEIPLPPAARGRRSQ
ncbi:MAG TPA: hypothetical protein VFB96_15285 [Pirellulaceae bacterium]|nr:hypothetical protein [Pirellulaceae bacterium]